jgi:cell division protein FtsB
MAREEIVILKNLEYWVLAQVGLEVILILLLIFFLMKIRSMSKLIHTSQVDEKSAASHLERLADQLATLEAKQVALEESLGLLREKAFPGNAPAPPRRGTASGFQGATFPKPGSGSLRLQVEDLHSQGFSSAEIAHRLGLHPTEVKMALELSRLRAEQP